MKLTNKNRWFLRKEGSLARSIQKTRKKTSGIRAKNWLADLCSNHRSFHCNKGGVYTHYKRGIMAHQCVHTTGTATTQNVRCLVSINIGSTGWLLQAISCISRAFFMGPYVSCVSRPVPGRSFVSTQSATVAIWRYQSKHLYKFPPSIL